MGKDVSIVEYLEAGLKAAGLRSKAIANNIANLQTPGYRRRGVEFEALLADALGSTGSADLAEILPRIFQPRDTPVDAHGNDVSLDVEIGEMIKNSAMQKTYLRLIARVYRQMEQAMVTG